jgi:hypothetical protein
MLIRIDVDTHRKQHTLKFYISVYIVCILLNNHTITLYWVFSYANELLLYASVKCLIRVVLNCVYTVIYLWSITATSGNSYHLCAVFALIHVYIYNQQVGEYMFVCLLDKHYMIHIDHSVFALMFTYLHHSKWQQRSCYYMYLIPNNHDLFITKELLL